MSRPPLPENQGFMPEKNVMCRTIGSDEMLTLKTTSQQVDFDQNDELKGIQMVFSQADPTVYHLSKMAFKFLNS